MLALQQLIVILSKLNTILKFVGIFFFLIDPQQRDQEIKLRNSQVWWYERVFRINFKMNSQRFRSDNEISKHRLFSLLFHPLSPAPQPSDALTLQ